MNPGDFPAPKEGFVITHVLIVADQDRSREFYRSLLGAQVLLERDPVIMKVANTWLTLNTGGGPTDDKPGVSLSTPADPARSSGFINVRVADIAKVYEEWSARSARRSRRSPPARELSAAPAAGGCCPGYRRGLAAFGFFGGRLAT
jgi:lactoylglutathione lyase